MNIAAHIKEVLTMNDVLSFYGYIPKKRMPCPIHGGEHPNMAVTERSFKCFVCGASGSVIDFVMALFNLNFNDALHKLDEDFRLGLLAGGITPSERAEVDAKVEARRRRQKEREALEAAYDRAVAEYSRWDNILCKCDPGTIETGVLEPYATAECKVQLAWYHVECAQVDLWNFDHPNDRVVW